MVDHLWSLAEKLVPLTRAEERRLSKDRGQVFDQRVEDRACKLADDARISTFDRVGENSRALEMLERRLSGDANGTAAGLPEYARGPWASGIAGARRWLVDPGASLPAIASPVATSFGSGREHHTTTRAHDLQMTSSSR